MMRYAVKAHGKIVAGWTENKHAMDSWAKTLRAQGYKGVKLVSKQFAKANPGKRKRMTRLQRLNASAKKAKQKRIALAAKDFLRKMNPSVSLRGIGSAVITKLAGGGYSVRPVKNPSKRARRRKR